MVQLSTGNLDVDYRNRLIEEVTLLVRLECGVEVPIDRLLLAITFLQGHLAMLMETTVAADDPPEDGL